MNLPIILQDEHENEFLHTLEVEVSDGGDIQVVDHREDGDQFDVVVLEWPLEHAEAIAMAILKAAKEARELRVPQPVLPLGLPAPRAGWGVGL
jgi:hypothetical protein